MNNILTEVFWQGSERKMEEKRNLVREYYNHTNRTLGSIGEERLNGDQVGDRIRQARIDAGLTQRTLASQIAVGPSYLSCLEKNTKSPSIQLLTRISEVLGVPLDQLRGDAVLNNSKGLNTATDSFGGPIGQILRKECDKICITSEPSTAPAIEMHCFGTSSKVRLQDYCLYIHDSPIKMWAFDLGLNLKNRVATYDSRQFELFLARPVFLTSEQRREMKLSFVVYTDEIFDQCRLITDIDLGIISVIQVDLEGKRVVREHYISRPSSGPISDALDQMQFKPVDPAE